MFHRIFYREFIFFRATDETHYSNNHAQISHGYAQTNGTTVKLKTGYNDEIVIFPEAKFHEENCETLPMLRRASHDMRKSRLFPFLLIKGASSATIYKVF